VRLLQLWTRLFVVSMLAGGVALAFTRNGAPLWLGTASTATIAAVGAIGGVVVIASVVRVRRMTRRLARAVAARTDMAVDTPYLAMQRAFAPLAESRAVRDLSAAVILPGGAVTWYPTGDERDRASRLYEIGSLTKPMTAELLATMIADESVTMATNVGEILQDVALPSSVASITLDELVTHRSGLPRLPRSLGFRLAAFFSADPYRWLTASSLLAIFARSERTAPPGTYSNFGFGILGYVLGKHHRTDYSQALAAKLLRPLGLANTFADVDDVTAERLARGHDLIGTTTPRWRTSAIAGAGGVCMTIADAATWLAAHLEPDEDFRNIVRMVTQPRAPLGSGQIGMAWCIQEANGRTVVWRNGGTGGFSSFAAFEPARRVGVIALAASPHIASLDRAGFAALAECAARWGQPETPNADAV
jgi:serine-type D-Ala-D-Ala carboxypeptidase/endopeptidase